MEVSVQAFPESFSRQVPTVFGFKCQALKNVEEEMDLRGSRRPEYSRNGVNRGDGRSTAADPQRCSEAGERRHENTHLKLSIINFVVGFNIYSCLLPVHHTP